MTSFLQDVFNYTFTIHTYNTRPALRARLIKTLVSLCLKMSVDSLPRAQSCFDAKRRDATVQKRFERRLGPDIRVRTVL